MIDTETLFILGAGASKHHGYPTGIELRDYICHNLQSSIAKYVFTGSDNPLNVDRKQKYQESAKELSIDFFESSTASIDLFLSRRPLLEHIGKVAIIVSILEAERKTATNKVQRLSGNDWYFYLFNRLTESLHRSEDFEKYKDNRISIITFNYDRSLENFLYLSLTRSFKEYQGGRPLNANEILPFPILHVYGQVAPLRWQSDGGFEYAPDFYPNAVDLADNIRVIYERTDERINKARKIIQAAERIFFLGFGYAEENLEALGLPGILNGEQEIYGTAKGLSDKEIREIKNSIYGGMKGREKKYLTVKDKKSAESEIKIEGMDCLSLLREYL